MLNRLLFIIFLAFGAGLNSSLAQDLFVRSKRLSLEEGLSSRWIYHSYQGPYGFVWMTNEFGLNRFDGYEVKTINKKEHGLTSNETRYLFFTPDSMVAVLNQPFRGKIRSIDILHPLTLQVCKWEDYINAPFEVQDIHRVITNKQHTNIIMTCAGDMYLFSKEGLTKRFTIDTSNKHHHFYLTENQNLWSFRETGTHTHIDVTCTCILLYVYMHTPSLLSVSLSNSPFLSLPFSLRGPSWPTVTCTYPILPIVILIMISTMNDSLSHSNTNLSLSYIFTGKD